MAFVLHTAHSISRSGVRMISLHQLVAAAISGALVLSVFAFAAGVFVGQTYGGSDEPSAAHRDPVKERFALDRLGDMAGRLVRLENDARSLVKKLSALETLEGRLRDLKAGRTPVAPAGSVDAIKPGAAGGRVLAPEGCSSDQAGKYVVGAQVERTEQSLTCIQDLLGKLEVATAVHSVAYMPMPTQMPISSPKIGSPFGNRLDPITGHLAFHSGLDFEAPTGTQIRSAGGGVVKTASWVSDLGLVVEIDHGKGLLTRYAHTSRVFVKPGDVVTPGLVIAEVGSTGRSTGPHLHFEILQNGRFVDPRTYLNIGALLPNV
jgi:murein DD-endopeptidase MepM/ murein hydrolase activator NlpD